MPGSFYSLLLLMIIAQTLIDAGGLIEGTIVVKPFGVVVTFLYAREGV